jgi:hypothetical protein
MPYGGERSVEDLAKMESCVKQVMAKNPKWSKSRAIATCKISIGIGKRRRGTS